MVRAAAAPGLRLLSEHRLTWLDVFTAQRLRGNQLAVVHDADAVDEETMLAFARETKLSETTFVQSAGNGGAHYRNRIWTMMEELPFAGHPSLGTAVAVALERGQTEASYVQQTPAGLQPVDVELLGDGLARGSMLQEPATFGDELDASEVAAAAGLDVSELDLGLPAQVVSTGTAHVIAPVRPGALARVAPDRERVTALTEATGTVVLYLAECDAAGGAARARGFFLNPDGLTEDPATGSAAGPLLAYVQQRSGAGRLVVEQGVEMGRASRLECEADAASGRVRVSGDCVVLATGTVTL